MSAAARVLHVVPPGGGGVDRCVHGIVRSRPGDAILHVSEAQYVFEFPALARFIPLAPADFLRWAGEGGLGSPLLLHAHGTVPVVRHACKGLLAAAAAPRVLTLHDVWFADPALPADERAARLTFVRGATVRLAPTRFIVDHARAALGNDADDAPVQELPLGAERFERAPAVELSPAADEACGARGFAIAVIGAIGAHKGLAALEALASRLPAGLRIVVLGYTERQLRQGWTADGRIWVHGVFDPQQLPQLVWGYGARLALFPPGMPESHCYALTDAWMSGLEVLAPDHGALAERVRRHGGGRLYDPRIDADAWCRLVVDEAASARRHPGPVPLSVPLPTMEEMMNRLQAVYAELTPDAQPRLADDEGVQRLAQQHLDGHFFRLELNELQRQVEAVSRERDALREALSAQQAQRQALAARCSDCEDRLATVQHERDAYAAAYLGLRGRLQRLVGWLPDGLRRPLVALARRLRG